MALRIPRGYSVNRPYFREVCEGIRPNSQAAPRLPFTGLAHVRVDDVHHDPIVIDAGTIVGCITGATGAATPFRGVTGQFAPAMCGTSTSANVRPTGLVNIGSAEGSTWGLPTASGLGFNLNGGEIMPIGVVSQPVYSSFLQVAFTNYKRQHSLGFVTDYVIQIPATNDEEVAINAGDMVMLGSGFHHGIGVTLPYDAQKLAGRYAKYSSTVFRANERVIGRCLKKTLLGSDAARTEGDLLSSNLSTFVADTDLANEFAGLDRVQTVPGLSNLSGSDTKGVPSFLLGARCDAQKKYWALTILVRL